VTRGPSDTNWRASLQPIVELLLVGAIVALATVYLAVLARGFVRRVRGTSGACGGGCGSQSARAPRPTGLEPTRRRNESVPSPTRDEH